MAKTKFYAVCVGRKPGLYTDWDGPEGANEQIKGISGYNWQEGYLTTKRREDAVQFLKTHELRRVTQNFRIGEPVAFEELHMPEEPAAKPVPRETLPREILPWEDPPEETLPWEDPPEQETPAAPETILPPPPRKITALDISRVRELPVSEEVDRFCLRYGFDHLSADQRRAVQSVNGKFLLFAVPGSGKTTVMMARAGYMVHSRGIPAEQLMTMTFTKASAKEMRDRYSRYFPEDEGASVPDFRTIHSFCMSKVIPKLRRAGFRCPWHVIDEDRDDKEKEKKVYTGRVILGEILKNAGVRKYTDETVQEMAQTAFSGIKNKELTREEYSGYPLYIEKNEYSLAYLFEAYQKKMRELDCMDYDDMLIFSLEGLRQYPAVLREIRSLYKYWSIDEAQDDSRVQNELLDLLAGEKGNLFMVGDDDQSIYSFRGAEPGMLLAFGNRPDVEPLIMGTNFRSCTRIVDSAKAFVEHNVNRADKRMNASHTEPGLISVPQSFRGEAGQYAYIDRQAAACAAAGKKLGVLYQLNASALPLLVHMHRLGIPFESSKGIAELLGTKVIGALIRVLRFSDAPCDLKAYKSCCKDLDLYHRFDDEQEKALKKACREHPDEPVLKLILDMLKKDPDPDEKLCRKYERCLGVLTEARGKRPSGALAALLRGMADIFGAETLSERLYQYGVLSVCDMYETTADMMADLDSMKKKEKQREKAADEVPEEEADSAVSTDEKPVVSLSTIHSAKGREWDHVILIDSLQEVFPGKPQEYRIGYDPEEASRVFYVAVTRAIERLDILTVEAYHGNYEEVSSFIGQYAYEADRVSARPVEGVQEDVPEVPAGVVCRVEPGKYYAVLVGPEPGVYTDWGEVRRLTNGVSVPRGMETKWYPTREDAWNRVFPGKPLPEETPALSCGDIKKCMQLSGGPVFNHDMDIPAEVTDALYRHLGTATLAALPEERRRQITAQGSFGWNTRHTDYHGRAEGYAAAYMAVNFYKIWLPLWKLLEKDKLPLSPSVLELGPGPGTSTWSFIEFYRVLARENPEKRFDIRYTAVERETDFSALFGEISAEMGKNLPPNMTLHMETRSGEDAFRYMRALNGNGFDMIVESNVLNSQEDMSPDTVNDYFAGLRGGLKQNGFAILIEPREGRTNAGFGGLLNAAEERQFSGVCAEDTVAVNVDGIALFHDAVRAGIRYSHNTEHWFKYAILTKKESA